MRRRVIRSFQFSVNVRANERRKRQFKENTKLWRTTKKDDEGLWKSEPTEVREANFEREEAVILKHKGEGRSKRDAAERVVAGNDGIVATCPLLNQKVT